MDFLHEICYIFTSIQRKQFSFFKPISPSFGGNLRNGKRKTFRPLDPKSAVHLELKSSRAKGAWSMLARRNKNRIRDLMAAIAHENQITVEQFANVGNHLHLLVRFKKRTHFQKFLRVFSGRVAMLVAGACKGNPQGKFWDALAFTRIVKWGRDLKRVLHYFLKNELEGLGLGATLSRLLAQRGMVFGSG